MPTHRMSSAATAIILLLLAACQSDEAPPIPEQEDSLVFVGAHVFDGTGARWIEDATIVVQHGRIRAIGAREATTVPAGAQVIDLTGKYVIPGLINAHGHVGLAEGLQSGPEAYNRANVYEQLRLYARYGITTVLSLGSEGTDDLETQTLRESPENDRARLFRSGPVLAPSSPEEATALVDQRAAEQVDFIKIRVDDNLGRTQKMTEAIYRAVIARAHEVDLPVAAHIFYLEDATRLLESSVDFLAHSVRDQAVGDTLINALTEKDICLCPTLVREVSTFVYESTPEFFEDPFFLRSADPSILAQLSEPDRQAQVRASESAQRYKETLRVAQSNLKQLANGGVTIAFGTDSGPPGRFQGYFEHMEMQLMHEAGLTPHQILLSATRDAARCLGLDEHLGTLERGKWADFVVLDQDPLLDILHLRAIHSVWIAGNRVAEEGA